MRIMVIFVRFMRTTLLTILTPLAFAANSILCRLALSSGSIDPASFATIRLLAGALALAAILSVRDGKKAFPGRKNWISAAMLAAYAVAFSFAYIDLSAGTGALILFGAVQVTMIVLGLRSGERPHPREWAGLFLALAGLVYLTSPGLTAPAPLGSLLMGSAGVAWVVSFFLQKSPRCDSLSRVWSSWGRGDFGGEKGELRFSRGNFSLRCPGSRHWDSCSEAGPHVFSAGNPPTQETMPRFLVRSDKNLPAPRALILRSSFIASPLVRSMSSIVPPETLAEENVDNAQCLHVHPLIGNYLGKSRLRRDTQNDNGVSFAPTPGAR